MTDLAGCLTLVLASEGGFSDLAADPGGATNRGITLSTLSAYRDAPCTAEDVRALSEAEARQIYAVQYAAPVNFAALPDGLNYAILDCSVHSGPNRAGRLLQECLAFQGAQVDGVIGVKTLLALNGRPAAALISDYCAARLAFCRGLKNWGDFGNGWSTRIARVEAAALAMAYGATVPAAAPVSPVATGKASGAVKVSSTASGRTALATLVSTVAALGIAATQASGLLAQYSDVTAVRYLCMGLACVSAAGSFAVALQRSLDGHTT